MGAGVAYAGPTGCDLKPDGDAIMRHVEYWWGGLTYGFVQLGWMNPATSNLTQFKTFDVGAYDEIAEFIEQTNAVPGQSIYMRNGLISSDLGEKAASDIDFLLSPGAWVDIDREGGADEAKNVYSTCRPTLAVVTGRTPYTRVQFGWKASDSIQQPEMLRALNKRICARLGGDPTAVNPTRLMRIGGTIAWPYKAGRVVERTETQLFNDRPRYYPMHSITLAFPEPEPQQSTAAQSSGGGLPGLATGRVRVSDLLNACYRNDQWHNNMIRLVAHLATTGRTDAEILGLAAGLTLPGYTVDKTLGEMGTALQGARQKWSVPEPSDFVDQEEAARSELDGTFQLLDLDELEALPPPTWLISELIADHGLSIVYGDPGAGKSFVVLDMALRLAYGMDWHGTKASQCGILYIAGEGARGLGKRVTGWRKEHALEGADAPFLLLPVAVQLLDEKERAKLCRTIETAKARAGFPIGLVIIDTVSRAIAGQDENGQEAMSLFVGGCAEIQVQTGGAVIGVHHSGKDSSRGMRGSTVLLGACDASLKITKGNDQRITIDVEKQKDAEEADPIHMEMKKVEWATGLGKEESTLVPFKGEKPVTVAGKIELSKQHRLELLREIASAWMRKKPWSPYHQAKTTGRYLPAWMADRFGVKQADAAQLLSDWQMNEIIGMETYNSDSKATGLRVLRHPEDWK